MAMETLIYAFVCRAMLLIEMKMLGGGGAGLVGEGARG